MYFLAKLSINNFVLSSFLITFDYMRTIKLFALLSVGLLFTACPPSDQFDAEKKIHNNNNNLPKPIKETFDGITFELSSIFEYNYDNYYTLKTEAFTRSNYDLGLRFSVESFSANEVSVIKFAFDEEMDDIEALHTYYIKKRQESVESQFTSEMKPIPSNIGLDGFIQVIDGQKYEESISSTYFTATFKIDSQIYVAQMIGKTGNMDYLYDDFLVILRSIH